jgi:hypothetical protein
LLTGSWTLAFRAECAARLQARREALLHFALVIWCSSDCQPPMPASRTSCDDHPAAVNFNAKIRQQHADNEPPSRGRKPGKLDHEGGTTFLACLAAPPGGLAATGRKLRTYTNMKCRMLGCRGASRFSATLAGQVERMQRGWRGADYREVVSACLPLIRRLDSRESIPGLASRPCCWLQSVERPGWSHCPCRTCPPSECAAGRRSVALARCARPSASK